MKTQRLSWFHLLLCLVLTAGCGSSTPAELLADAEAAVAEGDYSTADIHLRNLLADEPDNPEGRALLGQVSAALGNFSAAEAHLLRALQLGIDEETLKVSLLQALVGQQKFAAAIERFESGPELIGGERVAALRLAARAYQATGATAESEASYREALSLNPGSEAVRTELAGLVFADGRVDEATDLVEGVLAVNAEYAPALLLRAQIEFRNGRSDAAEEMYRSVMALVERSDPSFVRAQALLVELLLARGEVDEAESNVDQLLAQSPRDPVTRYLRARIDRERGDDAAAERLLEGILADFATFAPANQLLGAIKADEGQFGQAEMHLQAAVAAEPQSSPSRLLLAQTYMRQGKLDEARSLLSAFFPRAASDAVLYAIAGSTSRGVGDLDLAAEFFDLSEDVESLSAEELFDLANVYASSGELERAVRVLSEGDFGESGGEQAAKYLLLLVHLELGDHASAAENAADLAAELPEAAWPRALQGAIALRAEEYAAAREHYASAVRIEPNDVNSLVNLARAELLLGNLPAARETLRLAVEEDTEQTVAIGALVELALRESDFDDARYWLGRMPDSVGRARLSAEIALAEGRIEEGAADYAALYEREPSAASAILAHSAALRAGASEPDAPLRDWLGENPGDPRVRFVLGSYELERGRLDAAAEHLESVIVDYPYYAAALNNLAVVYDRSGDDRAVDTALRAYGAAPQNAAIADTVGWLLVESGDADSAMPYLEQAVRELSQVAEVRYHLGVALEETGETENAVRVYEALLAENRDFPEREDVQRRLSDLRAR
jgi:putative PEP-CTERM system TPR-repeat lipoprotein